MNTGLERNQVDQTLTWDLSALYKTDELLNADVQKAITLAKELVDQYKGKLTTGKAINNCIRGLKEIYHLIDTSFSYVNLAVSVDQGNNENQAKYMKLANTVSTLESELSFVRSQIIEADEKIVEDAIAETAENKGYLEDVRRFKPHALHPETEKAMAALAGTFETPINIYNYAKMVDMDFKSFTVDGKEYPLTFNSFEGEWEYENDTTLRRAAFDAFSKKLGEYKNSVAAAYQGKIQTEKTMATLRGFDSVFDSLLFEQKVDRDLYNRQIDVIMDKLAPHMRKYAKLLKRIHKLDEMTFADLKLDVDPAFEPSVSVEESKKYIFEALSVLGDDYHEMLKRSYDERWIDFVQNKGKSSGAFCASPYGSHSFILINWTEKMREAFVLAHELGHAGQSFLTHQNQDIFNSNMSLYFVEAPSTMNEMLMANYLMKTNDDPRFRRWVLASMISRTYYHNFVTHLLEAAYQREVYKIIDDGGSVNADLLNDLKKQVLQKFWGDTVRINEGAELTWMRQIHYYLGLYPYTYSAGLTVATQVSNRILKEGKPAIEDWRKVLMAGGSKTPVELAQMAGVDITTDKPLLDTIEHIGGIIDEIIRLTDELEA